MPKTRRNFGFSQKVAILKRYLVDISYINIHDTFYYLTTILNPGVVSEDRAVALLPPTSLAYNTNAQNPSTTQQLQHLNDPNPLTDVSISR